MYGINLRCQHMVSLYSIHMNDSLVSVLQGSPYYDNVRPLCYSDSDAVLLCFDISRPDTVDSSLKKVMASVLNFTVVLLFSNPPNTSNVFKLSSLLCKHTTKLSCFVHSGKLRSWISVRAHASCSLAVRLICAQMSARWWSYPIRNRLPSPMNRWDNTL